MKPADAAQILEALAKGIDPETGELFPNDSPLNSPHVIRALFLGARALQEVPAVHQASRRIAEEGLEQAWKPWSEQEEELLAAAFHRGESIAALADAHKRKPGGITARLVKLGLMERSSAAKPDA